MNIITYSITELFPADALASKHAKSTISITHKRMQSRQIFIYIHTHTRTHAYTQVHIAPSSTQFGAYYDMRHHVALS